jgi:hypothetical protein
MYGSTGDTEPDYRFNILCFCACEGALSQITSILVMMKSGTTMAFR